MAETETPPVVTAAAKAAPEPKSEPKSGSGSQRGRDRWKVLFVILLILGLLGTAAWAVLGSKLLVVRQVEVHGTHLLGRGQVTDTARITIGTPLARIDTGAVERRVAAIRQVADVTVRRGWPTSVVITIRERVPVAVVQSTAGFSHLDTSGVTVLTSKKRAPGLPLLLVAQAGPGDPSTKAALGVLAGLPQRLSSRLVTVEALSPENVVLRLGGGISVVWGAAERSPEKVKLLDALLATKAGRLARSIDVSAPGVVTTR
ncbi:cell division protein FtsQ/DivIB [Actinocorallia longicatena]|uniref:POTRA domain-containing protein n=1 Tax=Actinocorallia longicatena TaxID=111803 RepID=A0ABP6QIT1_9ACTN